MLQLGEDTGEISSVSINTCGEGGERTGVWAWTFFSRKMEKRSSVHGSNP